MTAGLRIRSAQAPVTTATTTSPTTDSIRWSGSLVREMTDSSMDNDGS